MARYDDDDETFDDEDRFPRRRRREDSTNNPGFWFGVVSLVMFLLGAALIGGGFAMVFTNLPNANANPNAVDQRTLMQIGFLIMGGGLASLVGMILGIVGIVLPGNKVPAVLGAILNALLVLGVCGITLIGMMNQNR